MLPWQDDLLKRVGEHHPQHDFIRMLAVRCSFMIFGEEHVKAVLNEVSSEKDSGTANAGLSLLAVSIRNLSVRWEFSLTLHCKGL